MEMLKENQYQILRSHTKDLNWDFESYQDGKFKFRIFPWNTYHFVDESDSRTITVSFNLTNERPVKPKENLAEMKVMGKDLTLHNPVNWRERQIPENLRPYWQKPCWDFLDDKIQEKYMWQKIYKFMEFGLCDGYKLFSLGIRNIRSEPSLCELVKLLSFSDKKDLKRVHGCGQTTLSTLVKIFEKENIILNPTFYEEEKSSQP
jgi:hypothetical protein